MSRTFDYETFNPYIYDQIPKGVKILDVGCATGLLGRRLQQEKKPQFIAGIEKDSPMAKKAKRFYDQIVVADLEKKKRFPFKQKYFDIIVCADVLEHLPDPLSVLKNLSLYLADNGFFLISVPNIAFVLIRVNLLLGRFDYCRQGGILDESHLRFFTRRTLVQLITKAGFKIVFIRGYNHVRPSFFFLKILAVFFPNLFSIQFLAKVKK